MLKSTSLSLLTSAVLALSASLPAQAAISVFQATMNGANEVPSVTTTGTGTATVSFDDVLFKVSVVESWFTLIGNVTNNHIHVATTPGGTGGVVLGFQPTFPYSNGTPGPKTGSFNGVFTLTPTAFNSLLGNTNAGLSYVNLHTTSFAGGEIRGFLAPVPEASSYAMMLAGLVSVGALVRRTKRA